MDPLQLNESELGRLRDMIADGQAIDARKELQLAAFDEALAAEYYTQQAIKRVKEEDERMQQVIRAEHE